MDLDVDMILGDNAQINGLPEATFEMLVAPFMVAILIEITADPDNAHIFNGKQFSINEMALELNRLTQNSTHEK